MAIIRLLLVGLLVFLIITVAAFVYLAWWQAILVSVGTFCLMVYGAKWFLLSSLKRMMGMARGMFEAKSRVLRGAMVDVHSVQRLEQPPAMEVIEEDAPTPEEVEEDRAYAAGRDWYGMEVTIFPNSAADGAMEHWDLYDLRLVPAHAKAIDMFAIEAGAESTADDESGLTDIQVIDNGQPRDPEDGKFVGPRRLRFVVDLPKNLGEVKFRYYFEQFGLIRLPSGPLPALT